MDAQDGVMYFLLDQMADQHVKELMMAYYVLLRHGEPLLHRRVTLSCHTVASHRHVTLSWDGHTATVSTSPQHCRSCTVKAPLQSYSVAAALVPSCCDLSAKGPAFLRCLRQREQHDDASGHASPASICRLNFSDPLGVQCRTCAKGCLFSGVKVGEALWCLLSGVRDAKALWYLEGDEQLISQLARPVSRILLRARTELQLGFCQKCSSLLNVTRFAEH